MSIKPLGNGKFLVRVTKNVNNERRERKRLCSSKQEANFWNKEFEKELKRLKEEQESVRPQLWETCLEEYFSYAKEVLGFKTFYNREVCLKWLTSSWKKRAIGDITYKEVDTIVNNPSFSVSYKKDVLKFIRCVFEYQMGLRKINFNPCKLVRIQNDKSQYDQAKVLQAMTAKEISCLLKYVREADENWHSIFFVTYYLGLRYSEALELRVKDINFERNLVTISRSWCRKKRGPVPPKNGTSRKIPMSPRLRELLSELIQDKVQDDLILPRVRMWLHGYGAKILKGYQNVLGIKETNYHSLRASFITHLLNKGIPIVKVQAMVGHSDLKTTQRYIRLDASDLDGATTVLD